MLHIESISSFYCLRRGESLPSFVLRAHKLSPTALWWTLPKRILTPLWVRSRVFTQRSRWSSTLFGQASKHSAWRPSNYPPVKMCLCHHCFVHSSFNTIKNFNKVVLSLTKRLQVSEAAVQVTLLLFLTKVSLKNPRTKESAFREKDNPVRPGEDRGNVEIRETLEQHTCLLS